VLVAKRCACDQVSDSFLGGGQAAASFHSEASQSART
jgi:hypothetical protein